MASSLSDLTRQLHDTDQEYLYDAANKQGINIFEVKKIPVKLEFTQKAAYELNKITI